MLNNVFIATSLLSTGNAQLHFQQNVSFIKMATSMQNINCKLYNTVAIIIPLPSYSVLKAKD